MSEAKNDWRELGNGTIEIVLTQGKTTMIDAVDWPNVCMYRWHAKAVMHCWYAYTNIAKGIRKQYVLAMHTLILDTPPGMQVDHWDHDGLNNRRSNIRLCTHSQNNANMRKPRHGRTSRYKGVHTQQGRYRARIRVKGRDIHLGYYDNEEDAAQAYNVAAVKHFRAFAAINEL